MSSGTAGRMQQRPQSTAWESPRMSEQNLTQMNVLSPLRLPCIRWDHQHTVTHWQERFKTNKFSLAWMKQICQFIRIDKSRICLKSTFIPYYYDKKVSLTVHPKELILVWLTHWSTIYCISVMKICSVLYYDLEASQNMQHCGSGGKGQQARLLYFTESDVGLRAYH